MEERFYKAAIKGSVETLHKILEEDQWILDKMVPGCYKWNPLHVAALRGHTNFVKELLHCNPKLAEVLDSRRQSALHVASAEGHIDVVRELIKVRPEMCLSRDRDCRNPLHIAAVEGKIEVLEHLLEASPSAAQVRVNREESILHLCVKRSQPDTLLLLLGKIGASFVNAKDIGGNTALHLAALYGEEEMARHLIQNNQIDVNATNADGQTATDIAYLALMSPSPKIQHVSILNLLQAANGKRAEDLPCGQRSLTSSMAMLMIGTCMAYMYVTAVLKTTPEKDRKHIKIAMGVALIVSCCVICCSVAIEKWIRKSATESIIRQAEHICKQQDM